MSNLSESKQKHRKQRHALLTIWCFVGLGGLVLAGYGHLKLRESQASVDWPTAPGRIVKSDVEVRHDEGSTSYSVDIMYAYRVKGTQYSSNVVVIGGHEYSPHSVVRRYPVQKDVIVSYDPDDVANAVLEPGVKSYFFQTWGLSAVGGSMFMALIFNTILRFAGGEPTNLLDKLVISPFQGLYWSLVFGVRHPILLAALVAVTIYLSNQKLWGLEWVFAAAGAVYALVLALALWLKFLEWLAGLTENT